MKRAILTGATGFVGANLARRLLQEGHEVHLFLRKGYNPWRILSIKDNVHIHIANLGDPEDLEKQVALIQPDWVFHLAAYGAYSSQLDFQRMVETNLTSTANLVNACVKTGFDIFVNTGSSSEYGYKDHAPSEQDWLEPNSSYAVTKAAATHYCRYIAQTKNVNLATLRLYSVFGPYEEPTRLIPALIIEGLQGKLPPLVNPNVARDYIYVDDVSRAYLLIASKPEVVSGKVYNLGSGTQLSLQEVVDIARRELPITIEPSWGSMPNRQWDTTSWVANINLINRDLGWEPGYSFEDGFKRFIEWFQSNQDMFHLYKTHRALPG